MRGVFLPINFLDNIKKAYGDILILRGYELLPARIATDFDIYINRNNISLFLKVISELDYEEVKISLVTERVGLLKTLVTVDGQSLEFDIHYSFCYLGLAYLDETELVLNARPHQSGLFNVPSSAHEVELFLIKELIHNSFVRESKIPYVTAFALDFEPLSHVLRKCDLEDISRAVEHGLPVKSQILRYKMVTRLICSSLKRVGIFEVVNLVIMFFKVKYLGKSRFLDVST